ncbi:hypothetical protein C8Q73DRAFT_669614 [Cubamyces lactineus]|nr:hypothetical protein C8Q73DRAFT_669614 [Cubamyces lactineus]
MESTFMKTSCRAANLRPLLQDTQISAALTEFLDVFRRVSGDDERGMRLDSVLRTAQRSVVPDLARAGGHGTPSTLSQETYTALLAKLNLEAPERLYVDPTIGKKRGGQRYLSRDAQKHTDVIVDGIHYRSRHASSRDSNIQFSPAPGRQPCVGYIQDVCTHRRKSLAGDLIVETFLTVRSFQELSDEHAAFDIFRRFPHAGGRLYYDAITEELHMLKLPAHSESAKEPDGTADEISD